MNHDSESLAIFGHFSGIGAGIGAKRTETQIEKGIIFQLTIPYFEELTQPYVDLVSDSFTEEGALPPFDS